MKISKITPIRQTKTAQHGMGWQKGDTPLNDSDFDKVESHKNEQLAINRANFKKHQEPCPVCSKYNINKELCGKGHDLINGKAFGVKAKRVVQIKLAKKKKAKSPKQHGFIEECIKKNKDKESPGGYCASIVDKVKGSTKWRKKKK